MGLAQKDLAARVGVSQPLIGKWESALSEPNDEQVDALARELRVARELFFVDRPRRLASMAEFYHRVLSKAKRRDVKAVHARCDIIDLQIERLLQLVEPDDDRIPQIPSDPSAVRKSDRFAVVHIEQIAAESRREMVGNPDPILNMVDLLESCGAIVIDRHIEVEGVEAMCRWVPELPKLFYINGSRSVDRIRYSLAHELGHTVMHFGRDLEPAEAEWQADRFASAFLIPPHELKRDLRPSATLRDFAALKRKWRVSMQAIIVAGHHARIISEKRYRSLFIQLSQRGWRKGEPIHLDGESPHQFSRLLLAHVEAGYSLGEIARLLFIDEDRVKSMLADATSPTWETNGVRLRLIR